MWDEEAISIPATEPDLPKWIWCLVANVREYPSDALFRDVKTDRRDAPYDDVIIESVTIEKA